MSEQHIKPQDTTTIAPTVLLTIVRVAATGVKGVARMGSIPVDVSRLFRGQPVANGVVLDIHDDDSIDVELYILVKPNSNMFETSRQVQSAVKRAIFELVGMEVSTVNVHIEDVDYPTNLPQHS